MHTIYKLVIYSSISLLWVGSVQAQNWTISEEERAMKMTVEYTEAIQTEGKAIFEKSCKMCHGDLIVSPVNDRVLPIAPNLGATSIQSANSDGEFYGKISNGKGGMPPFKAALSPDDLWKVIAYLRTSYADYVPQGAAAPSEAVAIFEGTIKSLTTTFDTAAKQFVVQLNAVDLAGNPTYAMNVKVDLLFKTSFGYLPVAKGVKSNSKGQVLIADPNIQPDSTGHIIVKAQTADLAVSEEKVIAYGSPWVWDSPLNHRSLWGTSANTPIWLLATYLSVVLGVWITIFWAILQLFRIWMLRER
jgi:mono/diheme cytochrome c family protein